MYVYLLFFFLSLFPSCSFLTSTVLIVAAVVALLVDYTITTNKQEGPEALKDSLSVLANSLSLFFFLIETDYLARFHGALWTSFDPSLNSPSSSFIYFFSLSRLLLELIGCGCQENCEECTCVLPRTYH